MKKIIFTILAIIYFTSIVKAQTTDLETGITPAQFRTTVNSNFGLVMDSIQSVQNASDLNYSFILSHADSIDSLRLDIEDIKSNSIKTGDYSSSQLAIWGVNDVLEGNANVTYNSSNERLIVDGSSNPGIYIGHNSSSGIRLYASSLDLSYIESDESDLYIRADDDTGYGIGIGTYKSNDSYLTVTNNKTSGDDPINITTFLDNTADAVFTIQGNGNILAPQLSEYSTGENDYSLYWNEGNGKITYGAIPSGGTGGDFDTTTIYTHLDNHSDSIEALYVEAEDTLKLGEGFGIDYTEAGDSLTIEVDTSQVATLTALQDTASAIREDFPTGGGTGSSVSIMKFIVGTTENAPSDGNDTLTHGDFYGKHIEMYRNGFREYSTSLSDSTLTVDPAFSTGDSVIIEVTETSSWTTLALRDTSQETGGGGELTETLVKSQDFEEYYTENDDEDINLKDLPDWDSIAVPINGNLHGYGRR